MQGLEGAEYTSTGSGHLGVKCCWVAGSLGSMSCVTVLGCAEVIPDVFHGVFHEVWQSGTRLSKI